MPSATVVTSTNNRITANAVVNVIETVQFEQKWSAFRTSLVLGDVAGALPLIATASRYREALEALAQNSAPFDEIFTEPLTLVYVSGHRAAFKMTRVTAQGAKSFQILFVQDDDGVWRLHSF